jgi:hypothetical protein
MLPTTFEGYNKVYAKPQGWTDEQCSDLPVWEGQAPVDDQGNTAPTIISCWKLSKEDLEEIQRTGVIYLSICGNGMPPVSLFTENPFIHG